MDINRNQKKKKQSVDSIKTKRFEVDKGLLGKNLSSDWAIEMTKDREHWKSCCKKMSFLSKAKDLPDIV